MTETLPQLEKQRGQVVQEIAELGDGGIHLAPPDPWPESTEHVTSAAVLFTARSTGRCTTRPNKGLPQRIEAQQNQAWLAWCLRPARTPTSCREVG